MPPPSGELQLHHPGPEPSLDLRQQFRVVRDAPPQLHRQRLRAGRWKLCYYHGEPVELYDLQADPGEFSNLVGMPEYQAVQEALTRRVLAGWNPEAVSADVRRSHRHRQIIGGLQFAVTSRPAAAPTPVTTVPGS